MRAGSQKRFVGWWRVDDESHDDVNIRERNAALGRLMSAKFVRNAAVLGRDQLDLVPSCRFCSLLIGWISGTTGLY
jgi:hypothetical protein